MAEQSIYRKARHATDAYKYFEPVKTDASSTCFPLSLTNASFSIGEATSYLVTFLEIRWEASKRHQTEGKTSGQELIKKNTLQRRETFSWNVGQQSASFLILKIITSHRSLWPWNGRWLWTGTRYWFRNNFVLKRLRFPDRVNVNTLLNLFLQEKCIHFFPKRSFD